MATLNPYEIYHACFEHGTRTVSALCKVLGISRMTYYSRIKENPHLETMRLKAMRDKEIQKIKMHYARLGVKDDE